MTDVGVFMSEQVTEKAENKNEPEFRHIVRLKGVDIPGNKRVERAILSIKGVGESLSIAITDISGLKGKKMGYLLDSELSKIEDILLNITKHSIPTWMFNRRRDFETGEDRHVLEADLMYAKRADITFMKKIRCRRGMRHAFGLKLRGQRTRSTGRHGKGVGVIRKSLGAPKKGDKK